MTIIELLGFIALSGALLVLGRILGGLWGTVGWLIGVVPVGLFWAWVVFCNLRIALKSVIAFFRHDGISSPENRRSR